MRALRRAAARPPEKPAGARIEGCRNPPWPLACRRDARPQPVRAAGGDGRAEPARPPGLAAELVAPGPEAARRVMQPVLLRKADRAMHLVRDAGADAGRFAGADFRRGNR